MSQMIPFTITQVNGQQIFTPKYLDVSEPPPKGAEIFIGRLDKCTSGEKIYKKFSQFGNIYQLRLMVDFYGRNRGFAFLTYSKKEEARDAVKNLHNAQIDRVKIAVCLSIDNRRLFLGGIPKDLTSDDIKLHLQTLVEGVKDVIIYIDSINRTCNRGFAFVEFETHGNAALARRNLGLGNLVMGNKSIKVDWAEPVPDLTDDICTSLKRLYISNIPTCCDKTNLLNILETIGGVPSNLVAKIHKQLNYAFIHFISKKAADLALNRLQGLTIEGNVLRVEWARPVEFTEKYKKTIVDHFCRSVPPKMRKLMNKETKRKERESVSDGSSVQSPIYSLW